MIEIKQAKSVALFTHINPDPDALGSVGAMAHALKAMGKTCTIFLSEKPASKFDFLDFFPVKNEFLGDFDLLLALDVSDSKRLGIFEQPFLKHQNTICIDHHAARNVVAKHEVVLPDCSSTCEILYDILCELDVKIDKDIANCLYTGIVGDTGCFMYSATTPKTHIIASKLIESGADFVLINKILFQTHTKFELNMIQTVVARMEIFGDFAVSYVLEKDKKNDSEALNTSELVNFVKSVDGIEIAALIKQVKGKNFTISLRSSEKYDVSAFAARFGGGGHKRASGMGLVGSLAQVKRTLIKELQEFEKH